MSPNDDNPEEKKKVPKRYLWFGYGSYAAGGDPSAFHPTNIRAEMGIFDKLLELFGVKEKPMKETEEKKK